jgi:TRAP-type C4-dicarboxylate transport system substrate-binding protein
MSRRATSKHNTSFGSSTGAQSGPTVISAIRKLKEEQDLLLREHKRYQVLNLQMSKDSVKEANKARQQSFYSAVKESANYDKEIKKQVELKKIEEVKKRFTVNVKQREKNKQMIQNVRKSFNNANHELYEQIRQKRKQN